MRLADQHLRKTPIGITMADRFANFCLVLVTLLVVVECGLAERRNILLWRAHPATATEALEFEYRPSTIEVLLINSTIAT